MQSSAMGSCCFLHCPFLPSSPCSSSWPHLFSLRNAGPKHKRRVLNFPSVSLLLIHKSNYGKSVGLAADASGFVIPAGAAHSYTARMLMIRRQLLVHSEDNESQPKYELDQEKALQSLNELDQQLESLLNKPVPQPKIRASNLPDTLRDQMKGEEPVFSGPSLAYGAFVLFLFTVLYNIIFLTVIKPSIDIPYSS